jgi:D-alanine-D-alanine ligase
MIFLEEFYMSDVAILFGGNGTETLVSCASAQHFSERLPKAPCFYWTPDGKVCEIPRDELHGHQNVFLNEFKPKKILSKWDSVTAFLDTFDKSKVLLLSLHGGDGENGWIQGHCEERKIFFTSSGSRASQTALDKTTSKEIVRPRGVFLAKQVTFTAGQAGKLAELRSLRKECASLVIKPTNEGSSTNLSFLHSETDLDQWWAKHEGSKISWLAEEFLKGRELTIGVMTHKGCLMALPPSEVILERNANFDYQGKYLGVGNQEITPADLSPKLTALAQETVLLAHCAIGCYGYSRSEVILTDRGPYYLETNTLPGFTKKSFIPQQLVAAGISVDDFIAGQIHLARSRYL